MGWSYGFADGREVGYSVEAVCDREGCEEPIDRGLAFCCGGMHGGGDEGCGGYFCTAHLYPLLCVDCADRRDGESTAECFNEEHEGWGDHLTEVSCGTPEETT